MSKTLIAYTVHLFTVSGVFFSFLALNAAVNGNITFVFIFLALALFVDGIDGTLARWADVKLHTPIINGEVLDNIIDFLNYVFVPAFVLYTLDFISDDFKLISIFIILSSSCYTFANNDLKTKDYYFSGFPALWNIVLFYFYLIQTSQTVNLVVIILLTIATFIPFKFTHPMRVVDNRKLTIFFLLVWMITSSMMLYQRYYGLYALDLNYYIWMISNLYFMYTTLKRTYVKKD
ncbi:CDP-alcohol phosphatidyltransferase family protein [Gammaproteobacteria bacterium]|nr:CDP-alcohol phosphatidyltransferase family protein [Gammaproteobacteria bacterium]